MIPHSAPCIGSEERAACDAVLASGRLAQGAEVAAFEHEMAAYTGRAHAVAVSSGTAALELALGALDVVPGQAVYMPSYACAALATATERHGGSPVLLDSGADALLAPGSVPHGEVAIVPHLFGARAAMPGHADCIEDAAQSLGNGVCGATRIAVCSFYATKVITTGEGGMVLTDEKALAEHVRDRRDYDGRDDFGQRLNAKMTDFQAALGRVQLRRLPAFVDRRRAIAAEYASAFAGLPLRLPESPGHMFYRYVVEVPERCSVERTQAALAEAGVDAKRPVYRPMHQVLGLDPAAFPGAERAHARLLSLPLYPSLSSDAIARVIEAVRHVFA